MSGSDRSETVGLVAVIATVLVFSLGLWNGNHYTQQRQQHEASANGPDLSRLEASPVGYQSICDRPEDNDQADLCQQWQMAERTSELVDLTRWQLWLTLGSLIGLGATLYFARQANVAAINAAFQAIESNNIAKGDQRPWITLDRVIECDFSCSFLDPDHPMSKRLGASASLSWRYKIENRGKSPAFGLSVKQKIVAVNSVMEAQYRLQEFCDTMDFLAETEGEHTVFPGDIDEFPRSASIISNIPGKKADEFFLLVALIYRTSTGNMVGVEARALSIKTANHKVGPHNSRLIEFTQARITR